MPDRDVETIRDLIFYQYAKIVARRAFGAADGKEAKKQHYGFIKCLKTIINCHQCAETLDGGDLDRDAELTVLDVDFILHQL